MMNNPNYFGKYQLPGDSTTSYQKTVTKKYIDSSHWEQITQKKSARPAKEESITSII